MERFEGGRSLRFGTFPVLDLRGTWREMGRQYGGLMGAELRAFHEEALGERACEERGRGRKVIDAAAGSLFALYPHRLKEFLRGMAETSGLSLERHLELNAIEVIAAANLAYLPHCSGIAAWGEYAADGSLVFGRNYDYLPEFRGYARHLVVPVVHPADGSRPTAWIGYLGAAYATTAMNADGLFLELNNGLPSGGELWFENRIPTIAALICFLLDSTTLEELEGHFRTVRSNFAYIVTTADDRVAWTYEWPVFDVHKRVSRHPGLLVATNHFEDPSWGVPSPDDHRFWWTRTRWENLMALAEHFKGTLDDRRMRGILDTRMEDLGATHEGTVYQIVARPGTRTIWLKAPVPENPDWTEIPLEAFLRE